jgi:hypothetical protein
MSKTFRSRERHIRVRGIQHKQPDLRRLARVLIELAQAEAEAAAQAEHQGIKTTGDRPKPLSPNSTSTSSPSQATEAPTPESPASESSTDGEAA